MVSQLTEQSNKLVKLDKCEITNNAICLGKMHLLPKSYKRLSDVSGWNCHIPTENLFEFLDHHLQPVIKAGQSYIKDRGNFLEKLKNLGNVTSNVILFTADVVDLYPSIPFETGSHALNGKLEEWEDEKFHLLT